MAEPLPALNPTATSTKPDVSNIMSNQHGEAANNIDSVIPPKRSDVSMSDILYPDRPPVSPITPTADATVLSSQPPPQNLPPPLTAIPSAASSAHDSQPNASTLLHESQLNQTTLQPKESSTTTSSHPSTSTVKLSAQHPQQSPLKITTQPQPTRQPTTAAPIVPPPEPSYMPRPDPVPINESENPDIMALRSAMSILQFQKQKALKDMLALQQLKTAAQADPENFANELLAGNMRANVDSKNPLSASYVSSSEDEDEDGNGDGNGDGDQQMHDIPAKSKLPRIPAAQNVFRCPPINWSQYHIVGEPLDKMHAEQQARPSLGEVHRDGARGAEHIMAAPYSPFHELDEQPGMVTRRSVKRSAQ